LTKTVYHKASNPFNMTTLDCQTLCSRSNVFGEFLQSWSGMVTAGWIAGSSWWHTRRQVSTIP